MDSSPPCSYVFTSATVPDTCSHYTERLAQNLSDMYRFNFEIWAAQLRSVIEIAVLMCEQKAFPACFSRRCKVTYSGKFEHSLTN